MNQPSAPTASPAATSGNGVAPATEAQSYESNFEARSAALFGTDPNAPAPSVEESTDTAAAAPEAAPAPAEDEHARARRERLAKLQAQEAASVDSKNRSKAEAELRQRLQAAEKRAEEAERMAALRIDPEALDESSFFAAAARAKVTPQRLGEWLREQTQNPDLAASRAVDATLSTKLTPIQKELAETKAQLQAFLDAQSRAQMDAEEAQAFHEFASFTASNAVTSPYTANFLHQAGPKEFRKVATSIAATLPPNAGPQALLDRLEENFAQLARIYAPQGAPAKSSTPHPNPGAAKPMTTVSNTLAQTRASVVDEDTEWASLPFEERSARLFR